MPLYVKAWAARMFGSSGHLMYLPFDKNFKPNDPNPQHNHILLSQVGQRPSMITTILPPLNLRLTGLKGPEYRMVTD
jgi:hypothetical protein